jgi:DNA repair protein RecN (Recombination protein N)
VGELLVDMHGQNEHQLLLRPDQQRSLLDAYAQSTEDCASLNAIVAEYKSISNQIGELSTNQELKQQQQALLQHQLQELDNAELIQDELDHIEGDFKTSANAASLIEKSSAILNQLEQESGVNAQLNSLSYELSIAAETDEKLLPVSALLSSAQVQTQESVYELNNYLSHLSVDEQTTTELEARLSELHDLSRKHNCQITELITAKDGIALELDSIGGAGASIDALQGRKEKLSQQYQKQAKRLSKMRAEKATYLSNALETERSFSCVFKDE